MSALCLTYIPSSPAAAQSLDNKMTVIRQINNQQPVTDAAEKIITVAEDAAPSHRDFTEPSLWWQQQQQSDALTPRLIDSWQAHIYSGDSTRVLSSPQVVDVVVNGQIWPLLSYLEQYAFITQFGSSAKTYGYQLRVFTGQRLVGLHVCGFGEEETLELTADEGGEPSVNCQVELDYFGQGAIRGRRQL